MLNPQEIAWAIYAALFLLCSIVLGFKCRHNFYLLPFILFGILTSMGHISYLIHPVASTSDRDWIHTSLIFHILPPISLLIFIGMMESQLIFIQHISAAIQNRDRWRSLYLKEPVIKQKPYSYWFNVILLIFYTIATFSFMLIAIFGHGSTREIGQSVCTSLMFLIVCINAIMMILFIQYDHIRKNRDDLFFLRLTPILFCLGLMGMTALVWVYVSHVSISMMIWIVLESVLVYLPLLLVLCLCIYTGGKNFKQLGRQYPVEQDQKTYTEYTKIENYMKY